MTHIPKPQRKALRFAYRLMRGEFTGSPYVYGTPFRDPHSGAVVFVNRHWIEPDRDPARPFLSDSIFAVLLMQGWAECRESGDRWLYRISADGCAAMGWDYPLSPAAHLRGQLKNCLPAYRNGRQSFPPPENDRQRKDWRDGVPAFIKQNHFRGR